MLYYGILNLGSDEFGPVNEIEMIFCVFTLIISSMLNSVIFGDIASLLSVLEQKTNDRQNSLDHANFVMDSIELTEKD